MKKPNYNAETQTGTSARGMSFAIKPTTRIVLARPVVDYNIHPARGGIIVCGTTLQEAIERADQL